MEHARAAGWEGDGGILVAVAFIAGWHSVEAAVTMAGFAFKAGMLFVQFLTGDAMVKRGRRPVGVTGCTP